MARPHVTLKLATSLDGRIATGSGESRWIPGQAARAEVHRMRATVDAIMIGAGTARADDPELLARTDPPPSRQPLRVVLDTKLSLSLKSKLIATLDDAALLVIGGEGADEARRIALEKAGAMVGLVSTAEGGVNLSQVLGPGSLEGLRVFVEGGGVLAANLIKAGLVDRVEWFRAPVVLGAEGRPSVGTLALSRLSDAPSFRRVAIRELGPDLWESYERI